MSKLPRRGLSGASRLCALILAGAAVAIGCCGCASSAAPLPRAVDDVQYAQSAQAGMLAFDRDDISDAQASFERARERAWATDDGVGISNAAYNLAACELTSGDLDAAWQHLEEARYNAVSTGVATDDIDLLRAKLASLRKSDDKAMAIALSLLKSNLFLVRLQAQSLLTLIAEDEGNLPLATAQLSRLRSLESQRRDIPPSIAADIEKEEGLLMGLEGHSREAAAHFDRAASLLRSAHRYRDIADVLQRSAASYEAAGDPAAADRYYRAARCLAATQNTQRARELADKAMAIAKSLHDEQLVQLISSLINELRPAHAP